MWVNILNCFLSGIECIKVKGTTHHFFFFSLYFVPTQIYSLYSTLLETCSLMQLSNQQITKQCKRHKRALVKVHIRYKCNLSDFDFVFMSDKPEFDLSFTETVDLEISCTVVSRGYNEWCHMNVIPHICMSHIDQNLQFSSTWNSLAKENHSLLFCCGFSVTSISIWLMVPWRTSQSTVCWVSAAVRSI